MSGEIASWKIDMKGVYELANSLNVNSEELNKVFRSALQQGCTKIKKAAAANLKTVTYKDKALQKAEILEKSINMNVMKSGRVAYVGLYDNRKKHIKVKGKTYENAAYILRWINQGTEPRYTRRYKKKNLHLYRGEMQPRPFFTNASRSKTPEVQRDLEEVIRKKIEQIANKKKR